MNENITNLPPAEIETVIPPITDTSKLETMANNTGYCNGSDMLLLIGGKAVGHCTSHTVTINSETKDRTVKPLATQAAGAGKWKEKSVIGLSASISAEGLVFYAETESGYKESLALINAGESVEVKCKERGDTTDKYYLSGKFVITSLERTDPAGEDATYSISLENDGPVTFNASAFTSPAR